MYYCSVRLLSEPLSCTCLPALLRQGIYSMLLRVGKASPGTDGWHSTFFLSSRFPQASRWLCPLSPSRRHPWACWVGMEIPSWGRLLHPSAHGASVCAIMTSITRCNNFSPPHALLICSYTAIVSAANVPNPWYLYTHAQISILLCDVNVIYKFSILSGSIRMFT